MSRPRLALAASGLSGAGALFFLLFVLFLSLFASRSGLNTDARSTEGSKVIQAESTQAEGKQELSAKLEKITQASPKGAITSAAVPGEWRERATPSAFELRDIFIEGEGRVHPDAVPLIRKTKAELASASRVVLTLEVPRESGASAALAQSRLESVSSWFNDGSTKFSAHLKVADVAALSNSVSLIYWPTAAAPER